MKQTTTAQDRLAELKLQERLEKHFDKHFDAGWREFVKEIHHQNDISNIRLFKIFASLKGDLFVVDLMALMGKRNKSALLFLTKKPKGVKVKDSRFKTIPDFLINKYPSGSYRDGQVFVQITDNRWVGFVY